MHETTCSNASVRPLVSVVTPCFNSADHLAQCIESVCAQTYENWEYVILDNASTDDSAEIAESYAARDQRIRVVKEEDHLDQRPNYNRALSHVSPSSKYCKIVEADNVLYDDCLARMVDAGETFPEAGIIGGYYLYGDTLSGAGIPFGTCCISGKEACRTHLFSLGKSIFGAPTNLMYRSTLVLGSDGFFDEDCLDEDTDACYRVLQSHDMAFVHQIVCFLRVEAGSLAEVRRSMYPSTLDKVVLFERYGRELCSGEEYADRKRWVYGMYAHQLLDLMELRGVRAVWRAHQRYLRSFSIETGRRWFVPHIGRRLLDYVFNPKKTVGKILGRR